MTLMIAVDGLMLKLTVDTITLFVTVNEGQRNKQTPWAIQSLRLQGWLQGHKVTRLHGYTVVLLLTQKKRQKRLT